MKRRSRETTVPDITPLIDVVFLLLIFFMVSTVFKKDELALLLSLPKAGAGEARETSKNIIIELTVDQLAFNGQKTDLDNLEIYLQKITDKQVPVELRIDQQVKYNRVIGLLDRLKKFQLTNLSLITDR
jgi:biopolymer transport protein ExbD